MNKFIFVLASLTIILVAADDEEKPKIDMKQAQQILTGATVGAGEGMAGKITGVKKKEDDSMKGVIDGAAADTMTETVMGTDKTDPNLVKTGAEGVVKKAKLDKNPGAKKIILMAGGMSDKAVGKAAKTPGVGDVAKETFRGAAVGAVSNGGMEVAMSSFGG